MTTKCQRHTCTRKAIRPGQWCTQHYRVTPHGFVHATPAKERVDALRAAGYSWDELSKLTGLAGRTLKWIGEWTDQNTVCLDTHQRVMAVPMPTRKVSGRGLVPALGTQRRIKALMALGWTQTDLAREMGYSSQKNVSDLLRRQTVMGSTAARVAAVFDRLETTPGPSDQLRQRCELWGWYPPLAWNDPDDHTERPNVPVVPISARERIAELQELGVRDIDLIAKRLGIQPKSVERALYDPRRGGHPASVRGAA